jgi:hypothetical protein
MLRHEPTARFEKSGRKYRLVVGSWAWTMWVGKKRIKRTDLERVLTASRRAPLLARSERPRGVNLWLYRGRFFWADQALGVREVHALAKDWFVRNDRRLRMALERLDGNGGG